MESAEEDTRVSPYSRLRVEGIAIIRSFFSLSIVHNDVVAAKSPALPLVANEMEFIGRFNVLITRRPVTNGAISNNPAIIADFDSLVSCLISKITKT